MAKVIPAKPVTTKTTTRSEAQAETVTMRAAGDPNERIKVTATTLGYYGIRRRRPGDVFVVKRKDFSAKWMQEVLPETPLRAQSQIDLVRQRDAELNTKGSNRQLQPNAVDPLDDDAPVIFERSRDFMVSWRT